MLAKLLLLRECPELPCYSDVVLALPISLCSMTPDFFMQRENEVSKASQALCWVGCCSRWNGDISFFLWSALFFQRSHTWLPLTGLKPPLDAASQPPPTLGDTTVLHWVSALASLSTSGCHRSLTQVKQWSCGHQVIVRVVWHQLRVRKALPSPKHRPARHLLAFNYNVALFGLHLTNSLHWVTFDYSK